MKTEFHDPASDDEEFEPDRHFITRTVKQHGTMAALYINVVKYRAITQITGIAGRMELTLAELDELIEELTEARDFVAANPPRKKETI